MESIPTIDLSLPKEGLAGAVRAACESVGFFYATGHGLSDELLSAVFKEAAAFFELPAAEKMALHYDKECPRGYTAPGTETLDPAVQKQPDTKEGYYAGRDFEPDEPWNASEGNGKNRWPSKEIAPGFEPTMKKFMWDAFNKVAMDIIRLLALALELPENYFDDMFLRRPALFLRLIRYAPVVSAPDEGIFGCGAHSDWGIVTLLLTDDVPGLEVLYGGSWIPVPPRPNTFIVNLGDLLQHWTNDRFKSTVHRVVNREGRQRISVPLFVHPRDDVLVECLPTCRGETGPKYAPIKAGEYNAKKYAETHAY